MSIEIRQLMIKSDIVQRAGADEDSRSETAQQELKEQVLSECRKLILAMLRERGER